MTIPSPSSDALPPAWRSQRLCVIGSPLSALIQLSISAST